MILGFLGVFSFSQAKDETPWTKLNGLSMVAINGTIDSSHVLPMKAVGTNWAAAIPFAFMPSHTSPELSFDLDWQWKGERIEGVRNYIHEFHAEDIAVMLKPQIWIGHGTYTGTILMESEEDWLKFEESYRKYIVAFTNLAVEENVEMICIGTELKHFVELRPNYWRGLIAELRTIYSGKLTYAANWDEYEDVVFWDALDFIGVDAYFPIATKEKRCLPKLVEGWKPHKKQMDALSAKFSKSILFTEYGYSSVSSCAIQPWDYSDTGKMDEKAQQLALKALYDVFWKDENYAGGFLWKWYPHHESAGGSRDKSFAVQNKKAEKTIIEYYK